MKALVIGATGATGAALLPLLLNNPKLEEVHCYGRRPGPLVHEKLHWHLLDFERPAPPQPVAGQILFSCFGTTHKDAGGKAGQWRLDYEFVLNFARAARPRVERMVLVSAAGANGSSPFFYPRLKGQLEQALAGLEFRQLLIFRPPLLLRPGRERKGEVAAARVIKLLNKMALLKSMAPLAAPQLAKAMVLATATEAAPLKIYEPADIRALLGR